MQSDDAIRINYVVDMVMFKLVLKLHVRRHQIKGYILICFHVSVAFCTRFIVSCEQ